MSISKTKIITTVALATAFSTVSFFSSQEEVHADFTPVTRIQGSTRFETSAQISRETFDSADTVIITNAREFADGLVGAPLAYQYDAPILIVQGNRLHPSIAAEIGRLGASEAIILGGDVAVSQSIEIQLSNLNLSTRRLAGATRFDTAELVAEELTGNVPSDQAILVDGFEFADALSVASFAALDGTPIYLTRSHTLTNPDALSEYDETLIIGGEQAISLDIENELNNPVRLAGANRYETNVEVLNYFGVDSDEIFIATGLDFVDALTGSILVAESNSGLGLVRGGVSEPLGEFIESNAFTSASIFGGEVAVSSTVESQLNSFFNVETATIVHTNDMHGRMLEAGVTDDDLGLAFVHGVYDYYQEASDEAILLDVGDAIHGTNNVHLSEGLAMIEVMNNMGYTAMTVGNHEFNYGWERLLELNEQAEFPLLAANVVYDGTNEPFLDASTQWELFDNTIEIFGLATKDTPVATHPSNVEGLIFNDEVEAARQHVEAIDEGIDHLLLLSHAGYSIDQQIAEQVDGIDLIIGGHSHTRIDNPTYHNGTFIAQAWEHTKTVGVVHLNFVNGELVEIEGELISEKDGFVPNESTLAMAEEIAAQVEEELSEVIGSIDVDLEDSRDAERVIRHRETNLGNLVADAVRSRTDADLAIMNGGGIRASIPAGEVTLNDVITVLPFVNLVEAIEVEGSVILEAFEHAYRLLPAENGGFLHISGAEVVVDQTQEPGSRVVSVEIDGEPLVPDQTYTVGTNDFIAAGGDGFAMFEGASVVLSTGELLSELLIDWIRNDLPIPGVEGRITINN